MPGKRLGRSLTLSESIRVAFYLAAGNLAKKALMRSERRRDGRKAGLPLRPMAERHSLHAEPIGGRRSGLGPGVFRGVSPIAMPCVAAEIRGVRGGRRKLAAFGHLLVTWKAHELAEADKPDRGLAGNPS